jgi:hypothetical protein
MRKCQKRGSEKCWAMRLLPLCACRDELNPERQQQRCQAASVGSSHCSRARAGRAELCYFSQTCAIKRQQRAPVQRCCEQGVRARWALSASGRPQCLDRLSRRRVPRAARCVCMYIDVPRMREQTEPPPEGLRVVDCCPRGAGARVRGVGPADLHCCGGPCPRAVTRSSLLNTTGQAAANTFPAPPATRLGENGRRNLGKTPCFCVWKPSCC